MTRWASKAAVQEASEQWSYSQVDCRLYGHNWRSLHVTHSLSLYTVIQRCVRCRNKRSQEVNEEGYAVGPWKIEYRQGYLLTGLGRIGNDGKAHLRLTSILNLPTIEVDDA